MRSFLITLPFMFMFIGACGTSAAAPAPEYANLHGRWLHDQPLAETPEEAQWIWPQVREALASQWAGPTDQSVATYRRWLSQVMGPRVRERGRLIQELLPALGTLARGSGSDRLFAALVEAVLLDDLVRRFDAFPPPPAIENDAEMMAVYTQQINGILAPIAQRARAAYGRCVRLSANVGPELSDWSTTCTEGSLTLLRRFPASSVVP